MKPYKILRPEKAYWRDVTVNVYMTEKKTIKVPLKLFMKCLPIPKNTSEKFKILEL